MLTPQEVACDFIPAFFERLASKPAELAEMYGPQSTLVIVDFENGTTEATGAEIPQTIEQWASILQGCALTVESYLAAPLYSGVNVYVTMKAESSAAWHYFHFVTTLESYSAGAYGPEAYYIRHQIMMRPGAAEKEQPAVQLTPEPEQKVEESLLQETAVENSVEAAVEQQEEEVEEPAVDVKRPAAAERTPTTVEPTTTTTTTTTTPTATTTTTTTTTNNNTAAPTNNVATQRTPAAPKSWASLASSAPKGEPRQPLKVTSHENGVSNETVEAPSAKSVQKEEQQVPSPKTQTKAPCAPAQAIGDRLMFNIDHAVSDEDIKSALGRLAANIVSLRNNSANGHVFIDFSDKEKVLDTLKANPPMIGTRKTRVNIYRQRTRQ
ncbi:uncharacterized protein TM35_000071730 [Trypanosoma theileri]|uniref:RNA-binding protein n=1 Tax=Trypanosoma theileri TaxID=67003 RepID=A0A1X0P2I6_9TRYP|nr:uncharacterized protein TM35_000071730 [Trypanosoma theileri]ORC90749.1 hypothetical protein TM35_000071730 [Trypanosoma theileri]